MSERVQHFAVIPAQAGTHLQPPEMGPRLRGDDGVATVARDFEALFIGQMLRAARAASLTDDPLAASGARYADMIDAARAELLAAQTPLGVARLLSPPDPPGAGRDDGGKRIETQ